MARKFAPGAAVLAGVFLAVTSRAADQRLVPIPKADGSFTINAVQSEEVLQVGAADKNGKRSVVLFVEGKRYEGSVSEVKDPRAEARKLSENMKANREAEKAAAAAKEIADKMKAAQQATK